MAERDIACRVWLLTLWRDNGRLTNCKAIETKFCNGLCMTCSDKDQDHVTIKLHTPMKRHCVATMLGLRFPDVQNDIDFHVSTDIQYLRLQMQPREKRNLRRTLLLQLRNGLRNILMLKRLTSVKSLQWLVTIQH